jgi:RNA polymerase sigma-70 factor (ECF subfamily)
MTLDTRYSLIAKLRDPADAHAWNEFVELYQPLIFRVASNRGLQEADARDVTQEVLARVCRVIESWDGEQRNSTFRGWLFRITRNLTIDYLRSARQGRLRLQTLNADNDLDQLPDPNSGDSSEFYLYFERQIFALAARRVQTEFQPKSWQAFWQTEVLRQPVAHVAEKLEMSRGAVYVARSRVIARLKREVQLRTDETIPSI